MTTPIGHWVCPQFYANYNVQGSGENTYLVQFVGIRAFCSCKAYRYSGDYGKQNCKHIDMIRQQGCMYIYKGDMFTFEQPWRNSNFSNNGIYKISDINGDVTILVMDGITVRTTPEMTAPCPGCGEPMVRGM